jgi:glycosyltransferase involved in cell wall biosynthesis
MNPTPQDSRPLLVFADDWGRHPSSCQHLVGKLLGRRPVVWVNTIGTRPPRLDWSTAKRVAGKLRQWMLPQRPDREGGLSSPRDPKPSLTVGPLKNPRVVSPKMYPSFRTRFGRGLNRRLLLRALRPVVESLAQPPVVVTTLPLVADLIGPLPVARWVYYCVDDFSVWPGYDGETMLKMERDLVPRVDEVVAVSDTLVKHIAGYGKAAHLLTHGVDLDHWQQPLPNGELPELARLKPPFVVFWGVIDRRMDTEFVKHLSANLAGGTLVFVGPREDPDPAILSLPRVAVLPPMPFARLPALARSASVLVMPYADLPVTRAIQPLKMKEYLATGKPVVVRELPATVSWTDSLDVASTAAEFTALVNARVRGGLPENQRTARRRLDAEGWEAKAKQFEAWLDGVC